MTNSENTIQIKRALLSVSDKRHLVPFASRLSEMGIRLISTGGTARTLRESGLEVTDVSELTGFPECLDGRVKTLHPHIHAGILARTSRNEDMETLSDLGIDPIELVVVNLYPFRETVEKPDTTLTEATEQIDIGGPTIIRAAAKNLAHTSVLTNPDQYEEFIDELESRKGRVSYATRLNLAREGFNHTAEYDNFIAGYFNGLDDEIPPDRLSISQKKAHKLRYGENPHQTAAVYGPVSRFFDCFHGKQLSYNNYLDLNAAVELFRDFGGEPHCAIIKHTVPCGVASAETLDQAWQKAIETDTVSPFGGIVIVNKSMDKKTAEEIDRIFTEIIIAPDFDPDSIKLLTRKSNRRLVRLKNTRQDHFPLSYRSIFCGTLAQKPDSKPDEVSAFRTVSKRRAGEDELGDLLFAWMIVKHIKSNGIVFAKDRRTLGIGSGQTSRIDSTEIAVTKAKKSGLTLKDSVLASDAFFPFADGVLAAADAGARAIIQPGGSIRDKEVIEAADSRDMIMIFTGTRHFRH